MSSAARPLRGRRIVVTRPEAEARLLAKRLEALGAAVITVPMIRIEWADPSELDQALKNLAGYDWVIFTSRNGVEAFFRRAKGIKGPRVAAIGPATAAELKRRGVDPDLVPGEHVAEAVVSALGSVKGLRFLLPRAEIARRALAEDLRKQGAIVDDVVTYHTLPVVAPRPDLTGVDAVTFTSSSTVRNFVEGGAVPDGAKVVCIGPQTAATAREYGLPVMEIAGDYTEDGLVAALIAALGT